MGGTWTTQNKTRAGAYVNFKAVKPDSWNPNDRNIMTMPVEMDWGPCNQIFEITANQLFDGSCEKLIGYNAADKESLVFRQALSNCHKALIYRLNSNNGVKASYVCYKPKAADYSYVMRAKHEGIAGNNISFKVIENTADNTMADFITYYRGMEKDHQVVSRLIPVRKLLATGELKSNDWIDIVPNPKQPTVLLTGEGFKIEVIASTKKFIGEEGNNLVAKLVVRTEEFTEESTVELSIMDDEMLLCKMELPFNRELIAEELPSNDFVIFGDQTSGKITTKRLELPAKQFTQVEDFRIILEAGATLKGGMNGKNVSSVNAKAKWGGLIAEAKVKVPEDGNNLMFSIQEDLQEDPAPIGDQLPFTLSTHVVVFPYQAEKGEGTTQIRIIPKDPKDTTEYFFNKIDHQATVNNFADNVYDRKWRADAKISSDKKYLEINIESGYIDREKHPEEQYQADGCAIFLQGDRTAEDLCLIHGKKADGTIVKYEVLTTIPVAKTTNIKPDDPQFEDPKKYVKQTSMEFSIDVMLELISDHSWNGGDKKLPLPESWTAKSTKSEDIFEVFNVTLNGAKQLMLSIKGSSGISDGEVVTVQLTSDCNPLLDASGQVLVLTNPIKAVVLEGVGTEPKKPIYLDCVAETIEVKTPKTEFEIDIALANNFGRYTFNEKAFDEATWRIKTSKGQLFDIVSIGKISDTGFRVKYKFNGELPYVENDKAVISNIFSEIVTDNYTHLTVDFLGSVAILFTYKEEEPKDPEWKIVINDLSLTRNSKTVHTIHHLNKKLTIQEMVEAGLLNNNYIDFDGSGYLVATTEAVQLMGGTSKADNYTAENGYFALIQGKHFNCMALPQENGVSKLIPSRIKKLAVEFIRNLRDNQGQKCQIVLYDFAETSCNYEGVISTKQGYKTADEIINAGVFTAYVAGLTAGAEFNKSNTFKVVDGAVDIIYYNNEKPYTNDEYVQKLKQGHFLLSKRRDLSIVCEKDQNSLHEPYPNADVNYSFTKNRIIRTLDEINNTVVDIWEERFVGKVSNNDKGRTLYRSSLINYIRELERLEAVQNFTPESDVEVVQGEKVDAVVVTLAIQPVDAMEKLYMTVNIN